MLSTEKPLFRVAIAVRGATKIVSRYSCIHFVYQNYHQANLNLLYINFTLNKQAVMLN